MGVPTRCCLLLCVLCACAGRGSWGQDLREDDAVCWDDGCFAVYLQRKTFRDSWRSCKERGGNLATVKRPEEAALIRDLFSGRDARVQLRVWIGLQRQPRQCSPARPLRGFTWITGDQDTLYTNWLRDDQATTCSAPRCVVMTHGGSAHDRLGDFKWLDGSCTLPVDGFLCRYNYKGMCRAIPDEGAGPALYATPFGLMSTLLGHVPFGSVATVPCPDGTKGDQSVLCMQREDGAVDWSKDAPLCSDTPQSWCDRDNGGCEHLCLKTHEHYYCDCFEGFVLASDGQGCWLGDACQGAPCEFQCQPVAEGYRCVCPQGYLLAADGRSCLDVDECLQEPCPYECVNAPGTFRCLCGEGYEAGDGAGDGATGGDCEDEDECLHDPCEHACENTPGSYACHCHLGYAPAPDDPTSCQDTDECQIAGTCQQMCVNHMGGFECHCEEGYELQADHYSCSPALDEQGLATAEPPFGPWAQPGPQFPWQLPVAWMTEPPDLVWLSTDQAWFPGVPPEGEPAPGSLPHWIPEDHVHDWADPDWMERAKPALTSAADWMEEETTPTPALDWMEEETTPTPAPDWKEEETSPTPAPDWMEEETSPTPTPDWMQEKTTPTPALDWMEEETTTTLAPDWPEAETTPSPAPDWPEEEAPPSPADDWLEEETTPTITPYRKKKSQWSPGVSPEAGAVWQRLWPSSSPAAPQESVGLGATAPQALGPDGASGSEFGERGSDSPPDPRAGTGGDPAGEGPGVEAPLPGPTAAPGGEEEEEHAGRQRQDRSWLVVALLVPLCIFVVVMVALGIVYCTRCAVQPRSRSITDCYRWITNAKPSAGAANAASAASAKSRV